MRILSIETSCDETAISIVEGAGSLEHPQFSVIASSLFSQTDIHALYGGVLPNLARRSHAEKIVPLIVDTINKSSHVLKPAQENTNNEYEAATEQIIRATLEKEPIVYDAIFSHKLHTHIPDIDAIAVTVGPGLEPALWVGISTAKALAYLWKKPLIPTHHMEGHIVSPLLSRAHADRVTFPALAVLISGGHTELVHVSSLGLYTVIGQTRDDAIGEAFDKVARLLDLPYPGGPHISAYAHEARLKGYVPREMGIIFPRPMLHSPDLDFSFSGIKTAVLYLIKEMTQGNTLQLTDIQKKAISREFEEAVTEVLMKKIRNACEKHPYASILVGGGVIANEYIRAHLQSLETDLCSVYIPDTTLATDNAVMIGMAGYIRYVLGLSIQPADVPTTNIVAEGNLPYMKASN